MAQPHIAADGSPQSQQNGGGIVNRVKESASAQLTSQKDRGIDAIGSVTQAVRSTTQKLRDDKHETIAGYVDKAADQIENWSRQLRDKDVDELLSDVQMLARRQPAVFIGSAFAIGLLGARFLKSSRPESTVHRGRSDHGTRYGGSSGISSAQDRGAGFPQERQVIVPAGTVVVPDVTPTLPSDTSELDSTARAATRTRKPGGQIERS
jgi:hypothetical protein